MRVDHRVPRNTVTPGFGDAQVRGAQLEPLMTGAGC